MQLRPLTIGHIEVDPHVILAPMSGVTSVAFRRLIREINPGAIGLVVTEFVSIEGLTRGNEQSLRMLERAPEERPFSMQIFGHEISRMVDAAKIAEDKGADIVDINSGCPVPKVVRKGGGCELMRDPEHMGKMLKAVRAAIRVPLTLKVRSGWDDEHRNALEIAHIAEDSGVAMLAVHGRTRQQLYRGSADWDFVKMVAANVKIPVVGSGDVINYQTARAALDTGVAGYMIGRAALANPWVFSEIQQQFAGLTPAKRLPSSVPALLLRYRDLLIEHGSVRAALGKLKQLTSQVTRLIPGTSQIRRELCTSQSLEQMIAGLTRWQEELLEREANPERAIYYPSYSSQPQHALQDASLD